MKIKHLILISLFVVPLFTIAQDAKEISKNSVDITRVDAMEMTATLRIYDTKGRERVRETVSASKKFGSTTKSITRFISPADVKGTGILVYDNEDKDDDMWIYMPALRKTRRIVSSEKGKSYMGSEFSNADMSTPNMKDFKYNLLGTENYEGKECWKIEAIPLDDDIADNNGFSRKVSLVEKENYFTLKNTFYDFDDIIFKEITLGQFEEVDAGKFMVRKMEAINLDNGRKSIMTVDKLQKGSTLTENNFSPSALEK